MSANRIGAIIFSNMHEKTIGELTAMRSCGSVPFGGRYRLIDFALSNMVNAGITAIGVITKSNYKSLMDHLRSGRDWDLSRKRSGLVIIPPYASAGSGMYRGRVEAMVTARDFIQYETVDWFVLSDCNFVFNLDIEELAEKHIESGADITCCYQKMRLSGDGLVDTVTYDLNKDGAIKGVRLDPNTEGEYNCGLNTMFMSKKFLLELIDKTQGRGICDFEQEILQQKVIGELKINTYEVTGTALRIGSMREYYAANMALLQKRVRDELFNNHPVYTKVRDEMPASYGLTAEISNTMVADGCRIEGSVSDSILFRGVTVGKNAKVKGCILMQGCTVGENADITGLVCDKNTVITEGRVLVGCAENPLFVPKNGVV
ncbi:MAG TPA: glucose-1-phosphate adenylyltransferase subunit GlgD [Oscillospiraceae bacterium]|nr:glucose-1-phosphate adenylyltransferase subunit GlgD [Oscillospiraceae bacterium]HPF56143.1 glucose-1-phosphate adenylyltransferase subunit GlgD [Clostridiales bacterium]HPK35399.1 glucose-1-phosphate adenylyltransferase subunit GlgD [Oscillospiraceae bacterium]HPR75308.1 glucose-1-phosphate adenylyltransferase subunit GlgD [Oscillospiraceae bacterium]